MKKSILTLGKSLSKEAQQSVSGGFGVFFNTCPGKTEFECLRRPQCAWMGNKCVTDTPHIV
ncbi:hypothetical protein BTO06_16770 [Tenacibaculum sp. SZ-18]|uniref:hypothetical protein n=1 Tax=Tenacibaculum sp. SZ-18 TaxID=754423 RepID=UPI000C2CFA70|nr:hypothetical protein [Tenacibaculum sp. SZ-18]AUC16698.1 hypothetical protein BTO06_16770 [Tenacibaculum sp. SZ-18]